MVRILNETEVCLGDVTGITELRPPLPPRMSHNHNHNAGQSNNNNMEIDETDEHKDNNHLDHLDTIPLRKVGNCCSNNNNDISFSSASPSPEPNRTDSPESNNGSPNKNGNCHHGEDDFDEGMSTDSMVSSDGGCGSTNGGCVRVPIIVVDELPVTEEDDVVVQFHETEMLSRKSEDVGYVPSSNNGDSLQNGSTKKFVTPIVVVENVDDHNTRCNGIGDGDKAEIPKLSFSPATDQKRTPAQKEFGSGDTLIHVDKKTARRKTVTSTSDEIKNKPQEHNDNNDADAGSHVDPVADSENSENSQEIKNETELLVEPLGKNMDEQNDDKLQKAEEKEESTTTKDEDSTDTSSVVEADKTEVGNDKQESMSSAASSLSTTSNSSSVLGRPTQSTASSSNSHGHGRPYNRSHHHHHCPAFHQLHSHQHPPPNFPFMLSHAHAAAAANNLSHLLSQSHLPFPHPNFPNFQPLPLPQHGQPLQPPPPPFILGQPPSFVNRNGPINMHSQQRAQSPNPGNSGKNMQQPQKYQHHNHQPQNRSHQSQNINPMMNAAVPMQLFAEPEVPPWVSNSSRPGGPMSALPPLDILGGGGSALGSLPPIGPLPTAIIPLPLDQNFPPVVLHHHPTNTNTPNTSSGYSTAGHSRSSSPMGPTTNYGTGLLQCFDNGLLPIPPPPPSSSTGGSSVTNPNFVLSAPFTEHSMYPQFFPHSSGQFVVYFHINPGVSVSFTTGDQSQVVKGPMTVPLVSTNSSAPIPLPMQVPPGHIVQQIVDENGTLRHVIVSHQPPLIPIPNYAPNSQGQQFYPAGPSGFPNFTPMQPGVVPCPVPSPHQGGPPGNGGGGGMSSGGYQSSIPVHAQKDERTQRQFIKLRRKFEQKQQTPTSYNNNGTSYNNQSSLRKDTAYPTTNGTRKVTNGVSKSPANGGIEEDGSVGSTGSVTSQGTQDEEEENRALALTEMLSSIIPPTVTEVTARSAYVQWSHPDRITESGENKFPDFDVTDNDFRYEVFINEKSRDGRFRSIFVGSALSCRVKDLKPGSLYAITYCAMLGDVKGNTCTPTNFTTLPAEPEVPGCPRAVSRSRSSIQLKWNPPVNDNGSKIINYVLEYDEGKGGNHFVEAYKGKNKQCTVSKLQPAYSYQFRLAAINDYGKSRYTNVVNAMTAGSPPMQPSPPTVAEAGVKYLRLEWKGRDTDDEYTLQMEDPTTGHGYLVVYNGSAPNYLCIGLKRNSHYKFRLRAQNEEGHSKWSDEAVICTLPDRPGPPHKPGLKGRVHAYGFKVRWDPPSDTGGVPIQAFALEIDQGNGYEEIYRGQDTECTVDRLSPGQSYALRVIAIGVGGSSDPSESCVITTEPVGPGKCHIPRIMGKPKSNSVHLKWSPPDWTGGSPINMYEVGCTTPDNQTQEAYRGKETECIVNRLLPGRAYLFQIRAFNRIGAGEWSDPLEVISGAGSPDPPSSPKVTTKTSHIVIVSWTEPLNNGSAVTEYRLQMAMPAPSPLPETPSSQEENSNEAKSDTKDATATPLSSFTQVYIGSSHSTEVKGLQPASLYLFRVQALNAAGSSDWSPVVTHEMPASSPNGVVGVEATATSSSISLSWKIPADNGSSITHCNVMMGETLLVANSNEQQGVDNIRYQISDVMPDTQYKIRVQAVNSVGPGPFSSPLKVWTKPLAPPPPKLECVSVAHFWMKLKWTEISSKNIEYLVQMINPYKDEFEVVYRGTATNAKVPRLNEDTEYQFRICALNGAGQGPFSDLYRFSTSKAPPPQVKGCKAELLKDSNTHRFEWFEVICNDTIEYQFQVASKKRDMDFKTMYRGTDRRVELNHDQLEEGVDYASRVCAIRVCGDGIQLVGPYSNNVNFHIPLSSRGEDLSPSSSKCHSVSSKSQVKVSTTFITTLQEKMSRISYESRVGMMAVLALIIVAFFISLITHHVVS